MFCKSGFKCLNYGHFGPLSIKCKTPRVQAGQTGSADPAAQGCWKEQYFFFSSSSFFFVTDALHDDVVLKTTLSYLKQRTNGLIFNLQLLSAI